VVIMQTSIRINRIETTIIEILDSAVVCSRTRLPSRRRGFDYLSIWLFQSKKINSSRKKIATEDLQGKSSVFSY